MNIKKCSFKEHLEVDAIKYCNQCEIFMCNKCEKIHSNLCPHHSQNTLEKEYNEEFSGLCKKDKHYQDKLEYFCKTHNKLCCVACIANYSGKGKGEHRNCSICFIEEIKEEKKNKYEENIKYLEKMSMNLENSINELKLIFSEINERKNDIKTSIQEIFTRIRAEINNREDQMLMEVDNYFEKYYCKEDIIKTMEKLPSKVKESLNNVEYIEKNWDNDIKLSYIIDSCIYVENYIESINKMNQIINKYNSKEQTNSKIHLNLNEDWLNDFLNKIKELGEITHRNLNLKLLKNQKEIASTTKGDNDIILTKINTENKYYGVIIDSILEENNIYKWKIKKINSFSGHILVGIEPSDLKNNTNDKKLYLDFYDSSINSKFPNFSQCLFGPSETIKKEVIIIININKSNIKFIIDNSREINSYMSFNKSFFLVVYLYHTDDSVEIIEWQ